jgi:hypothetical protein
VTTGTARAAMTISTDKSFTELLGRSIFYAAWMMQR